MQISQDTGTILISLRISQFVVTHIVKGFSVVNEAKVDFFFFEIALLFYGDLFKSSINLWKAFFKI